MCTFDMVLIDRSTLDNHHNSDDDTYEEELASIVGNVGVYTKSLAFVNIYLK